MPTLASAAKPPVRLWVFNHPFHYITEQVEFFCAALRANGHPVSISKRPSPQALNVLIENFSPQTAPRVADFCRQHRKRVAVIMTEHIDFLRGEIRFHGGGMDAADDYMASATKMGRLFSLLALTEHVRCFLRLGDLPELRNFGEMLPGIPVRTIPFPFISPSHRSLPGSAPEPAYDLVFTGKVTEHRASVLSRLKADYRVLVSRDMVSRRRRDAMNAAGKLVLNLPQHADWKWVSTMRVLAALRCRRVTVAVGDFERTKIARFCLCIGERNTRGGQINLALSGYNHLFEQLLSGYESFIRSGDNPEFPHDEFELWARLEL